MSLLHDLPFHKNSNENFSFTPSNCKCNNQGTILRNFIIYLPAKNKTILNNKVFLLLQTNF